MVNNQLKNIKKEGSLARRKTHFKKKDLNQVLPGFLSYPDQSNHQINLLRACLAVWLRVLFK
jgi:hypothetical protein